MSFTVDFRCDGPLCTVVCGTGSAETPHGWLALDDATHFCSLACLEKFVKERREWTYLTIPWNREPPFSKETT